MGAELDRSREPSAVAQSGGPTTGTTADVSAAANRQFRLFAAAMVLFAGPSLAFQVYAQPPAVSSPQPAWADDYYADLQHGVDKYNAHIDDVDRVQVWGVDLGRLRNTVRGERVNLYVTDADGGTAAYSFRVDGDAHIRDLRPHRRGDATVRVVVKRRTVERVAAEYTQARAVRQAYLQRNIRVTGVELNDWVRWWFIDHYVRRVAEG